MKIKKILSSLLEFHFYVSQGNCGIEVDIFALDEKDARKKLTKIFGSKGFMDARLQSVKETINE